jgi:uncharacterized membrane protein YphA (DoxX/SURF4 family)
LLFDKRAIVRIARLSDKTLVAPYVTLMACAIGSAPRRTAASLPPNTESFIMPSAETVDRFVARVQANAHVVVMEELTYQPLVEFAAGGAVVVGLLAPLAGLGLLVLILVAIATSGRQRIKLYKPIDEADRIDDWLYLPETLYAFMLIIVVSAGAGPYSLDALILGLMNKHVA